MTGETSQALLIPCGRTKLVGFFPYGTKPHPSPQRNGKKEGRKRKNKGQLIEKVL